MKMLSSVAALLLFTGGAIAQPAPPTGGSPATPAMPEATQPSTPPEAIPPTPAAPKVMQPMAPAPEATPPMATPKALQPMSAQIMTSVPGGSVTVTDYYKQSVYDPSDNKIGEVADVLIDKDGRVTAVVLAVGGFLGLGEKDVAIPFNALQLTQKDDKRYLVVNTTKDALEKAPGYKYDRTKDQWVPEGK
jgi:sporulation protein YlmC with PRC-barrel domain